MTIFDNTQTVDARNQMWSELRAQETQRVQWQQQANASAAQAIGDFHQRAPYADPGVALAAGTAAAGTPSEPIAQTVDQSTANGNRPAWTAAESSGLVDVVRQQALLRKPQAQIASEVRAQVARVGAANSDPLIRDAQGNVDQAATLKAAGVPQPGGAFNWASPTDYLSSAGDNLMTGLKAVTRTGLTVAQSGWQEVQNRAAQGVHDVGDIASSLQQGDVAGAASAYVKSLAITNPFSAASEVATGGASGKEAVHSLSATDVAQAVSQQHQLGSVDLGSGFFPGGTVHNVWQPQAARDVRGVIPGTNSAWTPGRAIAAIVQQPGTKQYGIMSGFIDGALQFAFDPSIVLSDTLLTARRAGQLLEAAPKLPSELGVIDTTGDLVKSETVGATKGASTVGAPAIQTATGAAADQVQNTVNDLQRLVNTPGASAVTPPEMRTVLQTEGATSVLHDLRSATTPDAVTQILPGVSASAADQIATIAAKGTGQRAAFLLDRFRNVLQQEARLNPEWAASFRETGPVEAHALQTPEEVQQGVNAVQKAADGVLVNAERPTAIPSRTDQFLQSDAAQPFLQRLADTKDHLEVMQRLGDNAPPSLVSAVTHANNVDDVQAALRNELGLSIRSTDQIPGMQWDYEIKRQVKRALPGFDESGDVSARGLQIVPNRSLEGFKWDATPLEQRQTMDTMNAAMKTVDVPYATRAQVIGAVSDGFADGSKEGSYKALLGFSDAIKAGFKAGGMNEQLADHLGQIWRDNHTSLYGVDAVGRPTDHAFLSTATGAKNLEMISPAKLSEGLGSAVELPDFRQVRRLTSKFGRLISDTSGDFGTEGQKLKLPLALMQSVAEDVFPRLQVSRIATAVRVIGDEQAKLVAAGFPNIITHPFQQLALVLGSSTNLERLGIDEHTAQGMLDEASGNLFSTDTPDKVLRATRATGSWTDVPFNSPNGVQGGLDMAQQFYHDPISQFVAQGKTTDQIIDWLHGVEKVGETTVPVRNLADISSSEGSIFHGTARPWTNDTPWLDIHGQGAAADNLMGSGLYTTDNPRVALSYTSKGAGAVAENLDNLRVSSNGRVYQLSWKTPPRVMDLESPQPLVADYLRRWVTNNRDASWLESTQEDWNNLERLVADPQASAASQIKAWRMSLGGIPKGDADREVANLSEHLSDTHDALRYTGGVRTGNETHNAYVVLHPENVNVDAVHAPVSVTERTERVVQPGQGLALNGAAPGMSGPRAFNEYVKLGANAVARNTETGARVPAPVDLTDDSVLRGWIDQNIRGQVDDFLKGNTDLRNAIGHNRVDLTGANEEVGATPGAAFLDGQTTPELEQIMRDWSQHPDAPERVKWNIRAADRPDSQTIKKMWMNTSGQVMHWLFTVPIKMLDRSPLFRDQFYQRVAELAPQLQPSEANDLLKAISANADDQGFVGKIAEYLGGNNKLDAVINAAGKANGDLTLNDVFGYAKGHALDTIHETLFNHERTNLEQTLRSFTPFVHAWRQVLGTWVHLIAQNPGIIRKAQMTIQGARDAGWFYTDPVSGEERFTIPGSDWLTHQLMGGAIGDAISHVPVMGQYFGGTSPGSIPLGGNVKDMNIVSGTFLPGFGPMVQAPAALILGNIPQADFIRGIIAPYGVPSDENAPFFGKLGAYALPGWSQKVLAAFSGPDSGSAYGNQYLQMVQQLMASGQYGTSPPEQQRLFNDAKNKAKVLTVLRGLGQFVSPASPSYDPKIAAGPDGANVLMSQLAKEYHTMQSEDYSTAVQKFIDTFGEGPFIAAQSRTKSVNGGLDASSEFGNWERDHGGTLQSYPDVGAYFAPIGSDFDSEVYQRQLQTGERKKLTGPEMVAAAQATIAKWKYAQYQKMLGTRPTVAQLNWLTTQKDQLKTQYPGYATDPGNPQDFPGKVEELKRATTDPGLKGDIQTALATYLYFRDQALGVAQKRAGGKLSATLSADKDADLRAWLAGQANTVIAKYPDFGRMFTNVLSSEVS